MLRTPALMAFAFLQVGASSVSGATCATCHKQQAQTQPLTSMGHALELVPDCTILKEHPQLTFASGPYKYTITRDGDRSIYSVTDGTATITVPIGWALGLGEAGQTYVFERNGVYYESRVSFYQATGGLDLTFGAAAIKPANLEQAAGREMPPREALACFQCHSTGAVRGNVLDTGELKPGVRCENCHPQAAHHMERVLAGDAKGAQMPHLAAMSAEETSDFCGRCHRTWADVTQHGPYSPANVRFQPYRLANSKCYDASDPRISCIACHNPHVEVVRGAANYDARCLACHSGKQKICPVAKQDCTNCHMPKIGLPGAHRQFTDHQIRIVRANQAYPR
jgi:hypothetical protein